MPAPPATAAAIDSPTAPPQLPKYVALLASLFFILGFITVISITLHPHLRAVFELNYTENVIESVRFIAYFAASIPSKSHRASRVQTIDRHRLCILAAGAFLMIPAARISSYGVTLGALFVVAVLSIVIVRYKLPDLGAAIRAAAIARKNDSLWRHRNLVVGAPGISMPSPRLA